MAGGTRGFADGVGAAASFDGPRGVAVDAAGNVFVADCSNHRIRKITSEGMATTFAGSGTMGFADGVGAAASFNCPTGVAVDAAGNVYVADAGNQRIRKITADGSVKTFAGSGTKGSADGVAAAASFNGPSGLAVDAVGNVYVADGDNNRIRKITADGNVSTFAGSGEDGSADGVGPTASFHSPLDVAVDAAGNVYVSDFGDHIIRKITADGTVSTLAGSGEYGCADGVGAAASFDSPSGVAVDAAGNVYVADFCNHRIRKITADGTVSTLAGGDEAGFADGVGATALFNGPFGVAMDAAGNLLVADTDDHRLRRLEAVAVPPLPPAPPEAEDTYAADMAALLADPAHADVTFVVCGEHITAHRLHLSARSPYVSAP